MSKQHLLIIGDTRRIGRALVDVMSESDDILSVIGRSVPAKEGSSSRAHYCSVDMMDQESLNEHL
jgi:short-subunit dehydrogenase